MVEVTMKELLEAGVHFGHQTRRWNPKMKPYIFGKRNGIYIIDLQKTLKLFEQVAEFVQELAAEGKRILFVGTKRQAQEAIAEEARRCGEFYVTNRWLGGTLTNFVTLRARSSASRRSRRGSATRPARSPRRSGCAWSASARRWSRTSKASGTWKSCRTRSSWSIPKKEYIAVSEANKLGIPVIAHRRHQLRPGADRLHHPGQRRRHPRHPAVRVAGRRRLHRRLPATLREDAMERAARTAARARPRCRSIDKDMAERRRPTSTESRARRRSEGPTARRRGQSNPRRSDLFFCPPDEFQSSKENMAWKSPLRWSRSSGSAPAPG